MNPCKSHINTFRIRIASNYIVHTNGYYVFLTVTSIRNKVLIDIHLNQGCHVSGKCRGKNKIFSRSQKSRGILEKFQEF